MTESPFTAALEQLTEIQRQAVQWEQGSLLVLAGPGSGKTQVLTCRIASLLDTSRDQNFRVLALTFTNKAADEMKNRVATFVPGLEERANIATFHSFCAQILRQHGIHIGINSDFAIYSTDADRRAVLEDALKRAQSKGAAVSVDDVKHLALIDRFKARLIEPAAAEGVLARSPDAKRIAETYVLYEEELRRLNALDFNSLILEANRLAKTFPAIAARYRRSHSYWLVDEFQDTNSAQYTLLRSLAGDSFRNVFAVADDDQIIYAWNGASYKQIQSYLSDFAAQIIQLPTNYRCPAAIVDAANRLVVYNVQRTPAKKLLIAGKTTGKYPASEQIQLRVFDTDEEEAAGIAKELAGRGRSLWGQTTVLARTKALLDRMNKALHDAGVPSGVAQRRDDFLSPEFRWLVATLRQTARPLDRRNLAVLVDSFNRMAETAIDVEQVIADAESSGFSYLATWLEAARAQDLQPSEAALLDFLSSPTGEQSGVQANVEAILEQYTKRLDNPAADSDLAEDMTAWRDLSRDIARHIGKSAPLEQFLQELQLRSKEPAPKPNAVTLMTIHGAKGREFDCVYVIGMAEDVMPSFQSRQKGDRSPEMEEERRNCFVAITRTKECLVLSRAKSYRGWAKAPSRFLVEMELVKQDE
jgi:DNA helicase-2/ATP-dependent DNA helicase PcrA